MFLLASQTAPTRSVPGGCRRLPPQFALIAGRVLALRCTADYDDGVAHGLRFHYFVYDAEAGLLMAYL